MRSVLAQVAVAVIATLLAEGVLQVADAQSPALRIGVLTPVFVGSLLLAKWGMANSGNGLGTNIEVGTRIQSKGTVDLNKIDIEARSNNVRVGNKIKSTGPTQLRDIFIGRRRQDK